MWFVGYLDRSGPLLDCYRSANVFVFASRTETQGLVLLEAMALGLPVVSTAVMGTQSVLDGAGGAVVVSEDEVQFASAMEMVLKSRDLQVSLGCEGDGISSRHAGRAPKWRNKCSNCTGASQAGRLGSEAFRSAAPT